MNLQLLMTVFTTVLIAELGDKTQLATMLFASSHAANKLTIFLGASLALIATSAVGVLAGAVLTQYVQPTLLHRLAGIGFIGIGLWTLLRA
jgi:putative Ca2+/H+ antiporter (TMEM165/GDT1 family)